jgi:hypothetical protein
MNGLQVVSTMYAAVADTGLTGWMDKKPVSENPKLFFTVAAMAVTHYQAINRIPVNVNVYTAKTESGLPKRDLLESTMNTVKSAISDLVVSGVYFSAEETITTLFLNKDGYDILSKRYDVVVTS